MRTSTRKMDYLQMSPLHALCAFLLPMFLINVVSILTSTISSRLYSQYAGQTYFTVTGYLNVAMGFFTNVVGSVYTAAWVKIAHQFSIHDKATVSNAMKNAMLAMVLAFVVLVPLLLLLAEPVLRALSVPEQFHSESKMYYVLYFLVYLPVGLAALYLTIVNGTGSSGRILWVNIFVIFSNLFAVVLLLVVFRMKFVGAIFCGAAGALIQLGFYWLLFRRDGYFHKNGNGFHPDWALVGGILRYAVPIVVQHTLCQIGYLLVTLQTNRLLSPEYITVLSVDVPLSGIMSAFSSAILAFCPPNHAAGKTDRMRSFLRISVFISLCYGVLCVLIYSTTGTWYYSGLFDNPQIVAFGSNYWFWRGLGFLPLAIVFTIRYFFDAIGMSKLALLSGIGEFIGNILCAFWLIPTLGNLGRSISYSLGWAIGASFLLVAYILNRKKIFGRTETYL